LVKLLVWDCCYFHVLLVALCNSSCLCVVCVLCLACLLSLSLWSTHFPFLLFLPSSHSSTPLVFFHPHTCAADPQGEGGGREEAKEGGIEGEEEIEVEEKREGGEEEEEREGGEEKKKKKRKGGEQQQQQQQQQEKVVKNKNEENHISDTHCFLRVCESLAAALVLWVLTLVS
jgi:hypothetical protein